MGTKQARDIGTDLAFAHEAVWVAAEQQSTAAGSPEVSTASQQVGKSGVCSVST
jgi:hypothetical protein